MRNAYKILIGKPEKKWLCGRSRHRWEDNIRKDVREVVWKVWTEFIWLRTGTRDGLLWTW